MTVQASHIRDLYRGSAWKTCHCITWVPITGHAHLPAVKQDLKKHCKMDHAESRSKVHQRQHGRIETGSNAELDGGLFL